jgi:hypothetical protein
MKLRSIELEMDDATAVNCAEAIRMLLSGGPTSNRPVPVAAVHEVPGLEPPAEEHRAPAPRPKPARKTAAPGARVEKATVHPPQSSGDSIGSRILAALKKQPLSSLELAEELKLDPKQVYTPCSLLKSKGELESRIDDTDGTRRWFLHG